LNDSKRITGQANLQEIPRICVQIIQVVLES